MDATGEALAAKLRPGNAGSGTATDRVEVLDNAFAQLPIDPGDVEVIARADSAGLSHGFVDACRDRKVRFVIGHRLTAEIAKVLVSLPESVWQPALSADGREERDGAEVTEITDLVDLSAWGRAARMIARREDPHHGAQLTFTDVDGHRFQVFVTDLRDADIGYLEALYRGRGRCERQICDAKDSGLANLPSASFAINTAWLHLVFIAHDLLAWTRLLCLDGELATAEPKRLRYSLLHTAGTITRSARRLTHRLAANWPWPTNSSPRSPNCARHLSARSTSQSHTSHRSTLTQHALETRDRQSTHAARHRAVTTAARLAQTTPPTGPAHPAQPIPKGPG